MNDGVDAENDAIIHMDKQIFNFKFKKLSLLSSQLDHRVQIFELYHIDTFINIYKWLWFSLRFQVKFFEFFKGHWC